MSAITSAPFLYRVKAWQLVGLGITGWVTLYSIAVINWATWSKIIGNTQGGCFATTMVLAGLEARRLKRGKSTGEQGALHWADNIPTYQLNLTLGQIQRNHGFTTEVLHIHEMEMGFGVRAVKDGRTFLFETGRWKEPTVDLIHAQATDENRKSAKADMAVIVSTGVPDEETKLFVQSNPLQLLVAEELQSLIEAEIPKTEPNALSDAEASA